MKQGTFSITDILICLEAGGKAIGFTNNQSMVISKSDVDNIKIPEAENNKNSILINGKLLFNVEFLLTSSASVAKVNEVVEYKKEKRKLTIYIDSKADGALDDVAIEYIMLSKLICNLSNMGCSISIKRYKDINSIDGNNLDLKILVSKEEKDKEIARKFVNYIPLTNMGDNISTDNVTSILSSYLKKNKLVKQTTIARVYDEYRQGNLHSKEFRLWADSYTKFFNLEKDKDKIFIPEIISKDTNTDVIISYLASRYRHERNNSRRVENRLPESEIAFTHPDVHAIGSVKYKVDKYIEIIQNNYMKAMMVKHTIDLVNLKMLINYNGYIKPKQITNMISHGLYLIDIKKVDCKYFIDVHVSNYNMADRLSKTEVISKLTEKLCIDNYVFNYNEI